MNNPKEDRLSAFTVSGPNLNFLSYEIRVESSDGTPKVEAPWITIWATNQKQLFASGYVDNVYWHVRYDALLKHILQAKAEIDESMSNYDLFPI